jgi:UDP-N-acetylglucosamine 2-epimerase (non-hydrolysing)
MIDSLQRILEGIDRAETLRTHGLERRGYVLVTLHRPSLVDDPDRIEAVVRTLGAVASHLPVVFPAHPRTVGRLQEAGIAIPPGMRLLEPLDYEAFTALEAEARLVITDSGGVQEETSVLGVPCITYRSTTERPITVELGTNRLVGVDATALEAACREELAGEPPGAPPEIPLWDGGAGERAATEIAAHLG